MSNHYSNPTANAAIGSLDRELRQMKKYARRIRALYKQGRLSPDELAEARRKFTGIYRHLLLKALAAPSKSNPTGGPTEGAPGNVFPGTLG